MSIRLREGTYQPSCTKINGKSDSRHPGLVWVVRGSNKNKLREERQKGVRIPCLSFLAAARIASTGTA